MKISQLISRLNMLEHLSEEDQIKCLRIIVTELNSKIAQKIKKGPTE